MDKKVMKILVTGADGSVAQVLIPKLLKRSFSLCLIGKDKELMDKLYRLQDHSFTYLDLEQNELRRILLEFNPEVVVHLAAFSTSSDEYEEMIKLFSANILFLGKLLDALKNIGLKLFIYTGSSTEFNKHDFIPDPAYLYSATKSAGRIILKYYSDVYNFKNISVIPYNVYGGPHTRTKVLDLIIDSLNATHPIDVTMGKQVLDFIHVKDLAELFISVMKNFDAIPNNAILPAGTGIGHSLKEIVSLIDNISGKKANINWGGIVYRKNDTMHSVADISDTTRLCKWNPQVDVKEGLRMTLIELGIIEKSY